MLNNNKLEIARLIRIEGMDQKDIYNLISIPPDNKMGDYALPCSQFAKVFRNLQNDCRTDKR